MKRSLGVVAAVLVLAAAGAFAARGWLLDRIVTARIDATLQRADPAPLADGRLHVVLCGTAAALPDPDRAGPCTAILAGGEFLLVDAGPGSWRNVDRLNLPVGRLSGVLLTHLHSDHIGDLGEAATQSWIGGRAQPLDLYGPPGVAGVAAGLAQVYAKDVQYRVAHHGADYLPPDGARLRAHEFAPEPGAAAVTVFARNGLAVSAFRVDHAPVDVALGYRIEFGGRVVVISGDTKKSGAVVANAAGADLLIHEALASHMTDRAAARARELGLARVAKLATDVRNYHTTPVEAAQVAQAAGVRQLVISHVFPPLPNALARRMFMAGVSDAYGGDAVLGADGMRFSFDPLAPGGAR